ncbi:MAG: amino acid ABC transporter substrate-binding protein [Kiloniellales bacterium]|nr:amino acid ABC transporter substrate-binding protein [Kiloniellales bacterium]
MAHSHGRPWGLRALVAIAAILISAASPASAQTLERIAETGVLKVGYREDARPFSFKGETGEPSGYAIELCREVAADVAIKLKLPELSIDYRPVSTEERFRAVAEGRIDILCGASTVTLARREIVSFSIPTFQTGISPLLRADAPAFLRESLAQRRPALPPRVVLMQAFEDRKFGVRADTTAEAWLRKSIKTLASNAEIATVDSHDEGLRQVLDGELDAYFADRAILLGMALASDRMSELVVGERLYSHEPYGLALAKGDEDFRLLVDRSLSRLYRTLAITPIYARYFGSPGRLVLALYQMNALPE